MRAQEIAREIEGSGKFGILVEDAIKGFVNDCKARGIAENSVKKYSRLLAKLQAFAKANDKHFLSALDVDALRLFRESWTVKSSTAIKELERLRTFYKFALDQDWLSKNPVLKIKPPKSSTAPTLPYSHEELKRVLKATDEYPNARNAVRLRALTLLLRYSGLRITDAVCLQKSRIENGVLTLRTAKTGTTVRVPLPPAVTEALDAIESTNEYFFWSGSGTRKAAVGDYQRAFKKLYKLAKVDGAHAHRWRDTFAVELLLSGVPIERVGVLLGHSSAKVTEKHYSPWNKARQDQSEADVRRSWQSDDIAASKS
jgi:integrase